MSEDGSNNAPPPGGTPDAPPPVPYDRFDRVNRERAQFKSEVEQLRGKVNDYEAKRGAADTLAQQIAELKASHEAEKGKWARERSIMGSGLTDPDGIAVAEMLFDRLGDEAPEGGISEWLGAFSSDPTKAPKPLQAYFGDTGAQPPPAPDPKPKPNGRRLPDSNNGARGGAPAPAGKPLGAGLTRDAWKANREQAIAQVSNEFTSLFPGRRRG